MGSAVQSLQRTCAGLCSVQFVGVCSVQSAVCSLQCVVCSVQCALCSMHAGDCLSSRAMRKLLTTSPSPSHSFPLFMQKYSLSHSHSHICTFTDPLHTWQPSNFCLPIPPTHHLEDKNVNQGQMISNCIQGPKHATWLRYYSCLYFHAKQRGGAHITVCSSYSSHVNTRMSLSQVRIFSHAHRFDIHHCDSKVQR